MLGCQRTMWPVAHPVRLVLQEGSKGPFSEGACNPYVAFGLGLDQGISKPPV